MSQDEREAKAEWDRLEYNAEIQRRHDIEERMTAENFATADDYKNDPLYRIIAETEETIRPGYNSELPELPEDFRF
jgi:hypothetical protein